MTRIYKEEQKKAINVLKINQTELWIKFECKL